MLEEELDMLFLLEHFSLEDLVEAERRYNDIIASDSESLAAYQYDDELEDEYANTSDEDLGDYDEDGNYYLWD